VPASRSVQPKVAKRATSFEPLVAAAFGAIVRAERLKREIAQDEFALLANIDRSYFGKLERGERQPSLALILRISAGLGISAAALLTKVERVLLSG
jgi:XRE family transcriptional regulator, regulator of sulfur utilization